MIEKIKNGELREYKFSTPLEVNGLVNFIAKHDLQNNLIDFKSLGDILECDLFIDNVKVTIKSLGGYRYNHCLTFLRAEDEN